ncbi:MAG: glycosyltransferase [Campylobacterales bacterium]|nr:glycosyltransferase [Campylobacterales bacterium]HEO98713.1 glycosyltransferase [Campylobacterota bacterium]
MRYKIGFFLPALESKGGVVVSVQTIANHLKELGHEVHLFPIGKTTTKETPFLHPINSNYKSKQLQLVKKLYAKESAKRKFDLLVSNHLISNYILHHLDVGDQHLMVLRQPSLLKHANVLSKIKKRILFPKIYNHKNIVMISQCLLDDFLTKHPYLKPKSSRVIYNSYDPELLDIKAKEKINLPTEKEYIISVGRFTKTKNQSMLIHAFEKVSNKNIDLILLGDGKETHSLKILVNKLNLNERVHFIGWKKNPYPYIKHAKLLVHTSKSETFGRVVLEGLALNTPVISTDIKCGPNEILTDELKDFLVPLNDISLLTEKIELALKHYPAIESKHLEKFKVDSIAQVYIDFIKEMAHYHDECLK